ncbi:double zinc ribbon and ankyrin repeat-containing protein 1 isoform X5 [Hemicordylus capensis]|uniref:double zinc ribbon and ankyrin repeat-containing protein 1 isoform X5 n=1 Tax=Hemicordylus capensis TaxID=884348 RepID=UPI0023029EB6|nr:double zinc ribbon and ankyrin repeat-containing protein 1 isoform X5 [Hemicordylus capensis]
MTAGSILVPQVIPLRIPTPGKTKYEIDTNTLVELKSGICSNSECTPGVTIYYTVDGSKPQLFRKVGNGDHNTFKYKAPIALPDGKITVKAVAVTKDCRESAIVTKEFVVEYVAPNTHLPDEDDDENFLKDLSRQEVESELSDLKFKKKDVNGENQFNWSGLAQEFQGLSEEKRSEPSLLIGPCNNLTISSDKEASTTANLMSQNNSLQTWQQSLLSLPTSRPNLLGRKEQGTQTIGLFYPSSKLLEKKVCEPIAQKEKQNSKISAQKPLLTAISPGRGYWRKQLDHVCAHIRSYTQNSLEFRTLIGEPQMGKLISATVHKDDYQVSLRLNYALGINKDLWKGTPLVFLQHGGEPTAPPPRPETARKLQDFLTSKPVTFGYHSTSLSKTGRDGLYETQASLASEETLRVSSPGMRVKKMMKTKRFIENEDKLSTESRELLKEVGPKGQGQPSLIEELIDEGADPNCTNSDDQPALTLAVLNKHHEAIPVLVQKGADIDHQSGLLNNTALHEAILLGLNGEKCIEVLLGCNADIKKKNARGLSACDLALTSGNNKIVSLLASKLGQRMLDKLITPS